MTQILVNTPIWVWVLLAALIALGLAQVPDRRVGIAVIPVLPIVIFASTAFALLAAFGPEPMVAVFAICAALAGYGVNSFGLRSPRGVSWDATARQFHVPGSWLPLLLILLIFACRFAVGVAKATNPSLANAPGFAIAIAVVLGACCGVFVSRAMVVLRARSTTSRHMS